MTSDDPRELRRNVSGLNNQRLSCFILIEFEPLLKFKISIPTRMSAKRRMNFPNS